MPEPARIALDATYSIGDNLSGVGVYSREILFGLAGAHPAARFQLCFRPHRFLRSFHRSLPPNCRRFLLQEPFVPRRADIFHGLNQRLPTVRPRHAVTTFHDLFVLTGDYSTPEFRRRFAAQARHAAAESDCIITVSEFTAGQVEQLLGVDRARLRVVHHGVHVPPPPDAPREKVVLHVGALQKRKNIVRLVRAFEAMPAAWRLALAGSAGFGGGEILRAIESSPARDRIEVLGYVTAEELARWYARAMILAFPSLDEGFGIPILEAMAAGASRRDFEPFRAGRSRRRRSRPGKSRVRGRNCGWAKALGWERNATRGTRAERLPPRAGILVAEGCRENVERLSGIVRLAAP